MASIWTYYPFKAIWTLVAVVINVIRFPGWIIWYIPRFNRPHPDWSLDQCVRVHVVRAFLWNAAIVEMKTPLSLAPRAEKSKWLVAPVGNKKYYTGIVTVDPTINPDRVGGTWYPKPPGPTNKSELFVLHFHGGAFMIGDGRNHDAGFAARTLIENTDATHVYAPQYRLSCTSGCEFPAAIQDAITTYTYLIDTVGIPEERIILSGDSAGGNMVLALVRYITEYGTTVGLKGPAAAFLWSPWVNPSKSMSLAAFNESPHIQTDYVTGEFGRWGALAYHPKVSTKLNNDNPYISAVGHPFATKTPIYISTGECEILFHDDVELAEEMSSIKGNNVTLQVEEHAIHDTILIGKLMSFQKEARQAVKRGGDWYRALQKSSK